MLRVVQMLVVFALVAAACGGSDDLVRLDSRANGSTIDLRTGDRFAITLEANPTTGYTWEVLEAIGVTPIGEPTHQAESDLVGAPGVTTFVFETSGSGDGDLTLVYHRPWEDEPPLERFELHVVIGE